jgi:hypothetical protein
MILKDENFIHSLLEDDHIKLTPDITKVGRDFHQFLMFLDYAA